jgi:putative membrane protein
MLPARRSLALAGAAITVAAVAVAAIVALAAADATAHGMVPSGQDETYLASAHQGNLAVIEAGQLAEQKGKSSILRRLGAEFVADHTRMDDEVFSVAHRLNVSMPVLPSQTQEVQLATLSAKSGTAFDAAWLQSQLAAHRQAMAAGQAELAHGTDPAVMALARQGEPVVQTHLKALEQAVAGGMPSQVNAGTGGQVAGLPAGAVRIGWALLGLAAAVLVGSAVLFGPRQAA